MSAVDRIRDRVRRTRLGSHTASAGVRPASERRCEECGERDPVVRGPVARETIVETPQDMAERVGRTRRIYEGRWPR